jgi:hypothetical protein
MTRWGQQLGPPARDPTYQPGMGGRAGSRAQPLFELAGGEQPISTTRVSGKPALPISVIM